MNLLSNILLVAVPVGLLARMAYILHSTESPADKLTKRQQDAFDYIRDHRHRAPEFSRGLDEVAMLNPIPWRTEVRRRLAAADVPDDFRVELTGHLDALGRA